MFLQLQQYVLFFALLVGMASKRIRRKEEEILLAFALSRSRCSDMHHRQRQAGTVYLYLPQLAKPYLKAKWVHFIFIFLCLFSPLHLTRSPPFYPFCPMSFHSSLFSSSHSSNSPQLLQITMQGTRGEVMWPKLIANKLLRKQMGSDRFVADLQKTEASNEVQSSSDRLFSETATSDQKETQKYKLFVSTWNVGGVAPTDDLNLEEWLDTDNNPCDIYALGFQEMVPLSAGNVLGSENSKIAMKWNSLIRAALNKTRKTWKKNQESKAGEKQKVYPVKDGDSKIVVPQDFKCIISKQMVGIFITVWVRGDLQRFVRHPSVSCVGCGIMGCLGNKGSVSIRFCLHETSFCFVCSHMASGGKIGDEIHRNSDAAGILARTSFPRGPSLDLPRKILDHDRVIWLGDLNYRISIPAATTRSLVERSEWDILLENDQLRVELSEGRVFEGWHEGSIKFAPTYKYYPNSDNYYGCAQPKKGEKRRSPAWCDRILWYGKGLKQKEYSRGESGLSDHRPVRAVFNVEVEELRNSHSFQSFFLPDRFDRIVDHLELLSGQQSLPEGRPSFTN